MRLMKHLNVSGALQRLGRRSILISIVLLVGIGGIFSCIAERTVADERQREREAAIVLHLHGLLEGLQDSETARRGYLLTGSETYLKPYVRSRPHIARHLRELESLTTADAQVIGAVRRLGPLSGQLLANVQRSVELRRQGYDERALAVMLNDGGELMEKIHQG